MKTIRISLIDRQKLKKQIQAIAKIALKAGHCRPYLQFLQFERIEGALRISATNGHIMSDIVIDSGFESDLEIGEKMHVAGKLFSKINESFLKIEMSENGTTTINNSAIAENLKQEFPDLERIRIKKQPSISITLDAGLLKEIADTLENNIITISFDPGYPFKPALVTGKVSSGIIMPINR